MGDLNDFLSNDSPAPESAAQDEAPIQQATEQDLPPTEPPAAEEPQAPEPEDTPPQGMDKRDQAIWREERNKRKELQAQVDQMNMRWQDMMQRMQAPAQPQPQAPEIPSFEEDPIGHLKAQNDLMARELEQARAFQSQQHQQMAQAQQFQQLRGTVDQMETQFATQHPDYHDAVGHLYEQVGKMATAMGYPPEMRQQIVAQTAMDISVRALQQGRSPAELAYQAAQQMGWGAAQAPATEEPAPAAAAPRKAAPTSLGAVAGKGQGGAPTWDAISKMDGKEFDSWWKQFERQQRGR